MLLQTANDIHLEFYYASSRKLGAVIERIPQLADTLMLAGDIHLPHRIFTDTIFEAFTKRWKKVFYVPGNHDYWAVKKFDKRGRKVYWKEGIPYDAPGRLQWFLGLEQKFPNLSVLRNDHVVEHEGRRFLGDTMWFPDHPLNFPFKNLMHDFDKIDDFEPWVYERNTGFKTFLERELREGDIVMTHHLPSQASVGHYSRTDPTNCFYVTELSNLFCDRKPAAWFHGHNHEYEDQVVGDTRILSNPKGYPMDLLPTFDKGLVIEV